MPRERVGLLPERRPDRRTARLQAPSAAAWGDMPSRPANSAIASAVGGGVSLADLELAKRYHPDRNPDGAELMATINGARATIVNSPRAIPRDARSAALFERQMRPSSRKRVKAASIRACIHRLGEIVAAPRVGPLLAHPPFQVGDQRRARFPPDGAAPLGALAIEAGLRGLREFGQRGQNRRRARSAKTTVGAGPRRFRKQSAS